MLAQPHGRRNVLTGLATAVAMLVFSSSAFAAVTVTAGTTGLNAIGPPPPLNATLSQSATINFTVAGSLPLSTNTCTLDGAALLPCPGSGDGAYALSVPGPLSLGSHKVTITNGGGGGATTYSWRVDPPDYTTWILSQSPRSYWKLDDDRSGGSDVMDDAVNWEDGHYYNFALTRQKALTSCEDQPHPPFACTTLAAPPKGYSVYFGGRDDSIDFHDDLPSSNHWTVEMWVKPTDIGSDRGIYQHEAQIWKTAADKFRCAQFNDHVNYAESTTTIVANTRYHVACVRSGPNVRLYINGLLEDSTSTLLNAHNNGDTQGKIGMVNNPSSWWKGYIDNVAHYHHAFTQPELYYHWEIGTIEDHVYDNDGTDTDDVAPPNAEVPLAAQATWGTTSIASPFNHAQYSPDAQTYKDPKYKFSCWDPVYPAGPATQLNFAGPNGTCVLEVDDNPGFATPTAVVNGADILTNSSPGNNYARLTGTDAAGNVWIHTHTYYVHPVGSGFSNLMLCTNPIIASPNCESPIAYYRFNEIDDALVMNDSSGNNQHGEYKNDANVQGTGGISGDANPNTRQFFGQGGYAYVNELHQPRWGYTMEGWWKPADNGAMMIMQHGSTGAIWYDGANVKFRPDERGGAASFPLLTPFTTGSWYYVVATYDGVVGKLYVEESTGSNVLLDPPATVFEHYQDGDGSADTFYLGYGDQLGGGAWLRGELDEVVYWNKVLSSQKLEQHFNADPPAGDVAYSAPSSNATGNATATAATVRAAADKKAKAKAKARAKAKAKARAKALKKAKARAKARAKAKAKARAKAKAKARARAKRL